MKTPKATSLSAVAREAGVSSASVSLALRNKPGVGKETRQRILRIARRMGYSPDARISAVMAATRVTTEKKLLPIAWLNNHSLEDAWRKFAYLSPYLEGASQRARELGYHLEEFWTLEPGMTHRRLSKVLYHRGIEGVIITQYISHIRLEWERLGAVILHGQLVAPRLPRIMPDLVYNLFTAVKQLRRLGYRRIGICLEGALRGYAYVTLNPVATYLSTQASAGDYVPPLFYPWGSVPDRDKGLVPRAWLQRYRPEVIVCHSSMLLQWVREEGLEVPRDISLVHLATDDDVADWAGIHSNRRQIGAVAVDQVVNRIVNGQFGLAEVMQDTLIRGEWHGGWTLSPG